MVRENEKKNGGFWKHVLNNNIAKKILYYLIINLSFFFVELIYGFITNSLGLISDSVHMFFDCSALVLALLASYFASLPADEKFNFGYGRIEVLSGLTNCIFLICVAFSIVLEAIERLVKPQEVVGDQLLIVAILGLLVNLLGICFLQNPEDLDNDSSAVSPEEEEMQILKGVKIETIQSDKNKAATVKKSMENENLSGLFLHIMADALGSVAVIISAYCIKYYHWLITDPLCSLGLSVLIVISILSLLKSTLTSVTLRIPDECQLTIEKMKEYIMASPEVLDCTKFNLWQYRKGVFVLFLKIEVSSAADISFLEKDFTKLCNENEIYDSAIQFSVRA